MPLATVLLPELENFVFLFQCPLVAANVRIDNIDPPFAALAWLTSTTVPHNLVKLFSNACPLLWLSNWVTCLLTLCDNIVCNSFKNLSLMRGPSRLSPLDILDKKPALLALTRLSAGHQVCNCLPIRVGEVFDKRVFLICHIHHNVGEEHSLIFFPLGL